jgi:hypothetical protein
MGKKRADIGVQRTLCVNGNGRREKGFGEVGARRRKGGTLVRGLLERGFEPGGEFEGVEVINGGEGEEFVQRRYHIVVLDIGQTADMEDEIGAPAIHGNLKTGSLDVAIAKAEPLALAT